MDLCQQENYEKKYRYCFNVSTGRNNEVDKILGLEIGADDYITKPFNLRELTIRARNLLQRTMLDQQPSTRD